MGHWGPFSLHDKVAAVTGGAMGIGGGIVMRLAEAGANVLVADLDGDAASKTAEEATAKGGGKAVAISWIAPTRARVTRSSRLAWTISAVSTSWSTMRASTRRYRCFRWKRRSGTRSSRST